MTEEPIKRFVSILLFQAQQDRATELVIATAGVESKPIRYEVDGTWYDLAPPPAHILPAVEVELRRLAKMAEGAKEGVIEVPFSRFRLNWKITMADEPGKYVLRPIAA
jgi:hypothetical protein